MLPHRSLFVAGGSHRGPAVRRSSDPSVGSSTASWASSPRPQPPRARARRVPAPQHEAAPLAERMRPSGSPSSTLAALGLGRSRSGARLAWRGSRSDGDRPSHAPRRPRAGRPPRGFHGTLRGHCSASATLALRRAEQSFAGRRREPRGSTGAAPQRSTRGRPGGPRRRRRERCPRQASRAGELRRARRDPAERTRRAVGRRSTRPSGPISRTCTRSTTSSCSSAGSR